MSIALLVAVALAAPPAAPTGPSGPATAPAPACDVLVITGHPSYPPVAWGSGGQVLGAAPELVTRVAKSAGVPRVESRDFGTWEKAQEAARSGEADVIFGIYKNDDRATYLDYVAPAFMIDPVSVVVRKNESFPFSKWFDLEGKKGVTNVGESYGTDLDARMKQNLDVARAPGVDAVMTTLVDGKADYAIIGFYPGRDVVRRLRLESKVGFLPNPFTSADMFVAFSRKSRCAGIRDAFAAALKKEIDAGAVQPRLDQADIAYAAR